MNGVYTEGKEGERTRVKERQRRMANGGKEMLGEC